MTLELLPLHYCYTRHQPAMLAVGLKVFNSYCSFTKVSAVKSGEMKIPPAVQRLASCHHVLQGPHLVATGQHLRYSCEK